MTSDKRKSWKKRWLRGDFTKKEKKKKDKTLEDFNNKK